MAGHPAAIVGLLDGLVNEWLLRALVLSSFMAHLVLVLLAGIRRHRASGGLRVLLWLAYQLAAWSAPSALGKLFLGNTSREEQLLAFWTPFLLMHLARPDNISAYSLEDNVLAGRQLIGVPLQVLGTSYVLYKHIIIVGDAGTLLPASCIMFSLGIAKYVENSLALWLGNLASIRSSIKKLKKTGASIKDDSGSWKDLDNEGALLVAHRVFYISKGAFADYSFGKKPQKRDGSTSTSSKVFPHGWKDMCKVVEMELSLMYDIMYTKAAMVHTWIGYVIRLASPPLTAVALLFFFFHSTDGQRKADVVITYILLIGTLVLEVGWLISAVGSTWTYAFLKDRYLLRSSLLGRWRGLRRFAVALGPSRDPSSYRRWSGTVGQYNILYVTTHDTTNPCSAILKLIGMDDTGMEYQYSRGLEILPPVRDLLFERIWEMLSPVVLAKKPEEKKKKEEEEKKRREGIELVPDHEAALRWRRALDEALEFGPEFQETVLTWHIATHIFLLCRPEKADMYNFEYVKAIEELSNYMMFLVVVRPSMLPGLKLRSLHDATHDALKDIWKISGTSGCMARERERERERERKLASILLSVGTLYAEHDATRDALKEIWRISGTPSCMAREREFASILQNNVILSEGTLYAELMLTRLSIMSWHKVFGKFSIEDQYKFWTSFGQFAYLLRLSYSELTSNSPEYELTMQKMLKLILDSWVRLLIYASIRCSRDSHAKQLSRGGELTTVVWILAEHAGIYRVPV